jgi:hypothetical protein
MQAQDLARVVEHQFARRSERQAAPIAMKQCLLQQFLQPLDLKTERGLGDKTPFPKH